MVTPPELASEPGTYNGHDGIRRWFDSFYEAMEEVRLEPNRMETAGDQVVVSYRIVARGRSTGLEMVQEAVMLCTVREGLLGRMEFFATWAEAVQAAGAPS
jgi:ketosteroid isomerase-like protein